MAVDYIKDGHCNWCGKLCGAFKDELSEREHLISKLCQECQDSFFDEMDCDDAEEWERDQLASDGND
jgi:hypothetical protein